MGYTGSRRLSSRPGSCPAHPVKQIFWFYDGLAKPRDSDAVAAWRQRMGTDDAQVIYRERAATAECVNAQARNLGLQQVRVRGRAKVRNVLLFHALAHNLMRTLALLPEVLGLGTAAPDRVMMPG
jgi:hypothetical protein